VKSAPGLADWATYFAAWSAAAGGDVEAAHTRVQQLHAEFRRDYGWKARSYAYEKSNNLARAASIADSAYRQIDGQRRYEAGLEVARLRKQRALLNAVLDSGSVPVRGRAAELLLQWRPANADEWLRVARAKRAIGEPTAALDAFKRAGTLQAKWERAQYQFLLRRYGNAAAQAQPVINGNNERAADAQFLRARALLRNDQVSAARTNLRGVLDKSNAAKLTRAGAAFMLGDLEQDAGNQARAREYFRTAVQEYPTSEPAANAYMRLGLRALVEKDNKEAIRLFDQYKRTHARTNYAAQAAYWAARAHLIAGEDSAGRAFMRDVVAIDPFSYYGIQAAQFLKIPMPALAKGTASSAEVQQQARGAVQRLELLRNLNLSEAASYERERTRGWIAEQAGGLHALVEALQNSNHVSESITLAWRVRDQDKQWSERTLKMIYPFPYQEVITKNARLQKQDPYLIAALIRQESMFNPTVRSNAGAIGLMQVMPRTGAAVARRIGIPNYSTSRLTDPEVNVRIGAEHFGNLMSEYGNNLELVIASYNAGMTPVSRWRTLPHLGDMEIFTERIPYAETREYVKILKRNHRMYEYLYGSRE
jgi:soluble lytic murein transglycosylase